MSATVSGRAALALACAYCLVGSNRDSVSVTHRRGGVGWGMPATVSGRAVDARVCVWPRGLESRHWCAYGLEGSNRDTSGCSGNVPCAVGGSGLRIAQRTRGGRRTHCRQPSHTHCNLLLPSSTKIELRSSRARWLHARHGPRLRVWRANPRKGGRTSVSLDDSVGVLTGSYR